MTDCVTLFGQFQKSLFGIDIEPDSSQTDNLCWWESREHCLKSTPVTRSSPLTEYQTYNLLLLLVFVWSTLPLQSCTCWKFHHNSTWYVSYSGFIILSKGYCSLLAKSNLLQQRLLLFKGEADQPMLVLLFSVETESYLILLKLESRRSSHLLWHFDFLDDAWQFKPCPNRISQLKL